MTDKKINKEELSYTEADIQSLEYCEHIRQRYGMYVGADPSTHISNEVLDNSIDEAMSGFADLIIVKLDTKENKMQIIDNGRGIPNGTHPKTGLNTLVVAVSKENSGGKFNGSKSFKASGGLNGTGLKATNALSEYFEAISERDGRRIQACFSKGKQIGDIKNLPLTGNRGTTITFIPDKKLLSKDSLYKFKPDKIKESCQMRAYLNKGVTIKLSIDNKEEYIFNYNRGVEEYIENKVAKPLYGMKPITIEKEYEDNKYEISFVYDSENTDEKMLLYTNSIRNTSGTNETGFKKGLTIAMNKFISKHELIPKKQKLKNISGDDIRRGIVCCINGKILEPLYSAQIKTEINNTEITGEISKMITDYLEVYMEENLELFKKICNRIIQFAIATNNLKNLQKKIVTVSSAASGFAFSDKYTDCKLSDPNVIELLICEGNSAAGSLKPGRIGLIQAVYALKGKPLNTYGASGSSLISNFEINELMLIIFGTNNKKEIKYENIRFKRIIFAADSDEDGQKFYLVTVCVNI